MAYNYQPVYGVEPYEDVAGVGLAAPFGGGAKITGQNLLVSLWTIDDEDMTSGRLLKPKKNTEEAAIQAEARAADGALDFLNSLDQVFDSRTATRFLFQFDAVPGFGPPFLAILNPPGELKDFYSRWLKAKVDNNYPTGIEQVIEKSAFAPLAWNAHCATVVQSGSTIVEGAFGAQTEFLETFALTSGANGVFPNIPEVSFLSPSGFVAWLDQVIAGDWYWPVLISQGPSEGQTSMFTLSWPHSIARGA